VAIKPRECFLLLKEIKMERREFLGTSGCALAGLAVASVLTGSVANAETQKQRNYK
jgi:hypothetical protein